MVVRPDSTVALLSIRPRFAEAILSGVKRVEFRRRPFGRPIDNVLIYATSPIQCIVGYFVVAKVHQDSPTGLWNRYAAVAGLREEEFAAYMTGVAQAIAIEVRHAFALNTPLPLAEVRDGLRAPQSYQYVDPAAIAEILSRADVRAA